MKTENRVGVHKGEYDVQSTFEGDNNVLMQQVLNHLFKGFGIRVLGLRVSGEIRSARRYCQSTSLQRGGKSR